LNHEAKIRLSPGSSRKKGHCAVAWRRVPD
jgi:hypothetical protein